MDADVFTECLEVLSTVKVLSTEQTNILFNKLKTLYPIRFEGRIDWENVNPHVEAPNHLKIIPSLVSLLPTYFFQPNLERVYVLWDDAEIPAISTTLQDIVDHFTEVEWVAMNIWIVPPSWEYMIEIYHFGQITVGIPPKEKTSIQRKI